MSSFIAGNWKMNLNSSSAKKLAEELVDFKGEMVVIPSFTNIPVVYDVLKNSQVKLGAQNVSQFESGAYTGEVSIEQLMDFNVEYILVGHSERREIFKETDLEINEKLLQIQKHGITPIFCVGESLEIRESGRAEEFVKSQIESGLKGASSNFIIAYEPIWAIGTGVSASVEDVEKMSDFIRSLLSSMFENSPIKILYGGSVKPSNAKELLALKNVDGALVGGASLVAEDFLEIAK